MDGTVTISLEDFDTLRDQAKRINKLDEVKEKIAKSEGKDLILPVSHQDLCILFDIKKECYEKVHFKITP